MSTKLKFPVPNPDMKRYEAIKEEGFSAFFERRENYIKFQNSKKTADIDYMPVKADIENVSRCNLSCRHCLVGHLNGKKRGEDLSLESFKKVIDEQYGLVEIKLQGLGEPLLQNEFSDMIAHAAYKKIWVRSTTNGMLLNIRDMYKRIIDAGVGEMQVSIDGATKATQEKIRVKSDFDVVKKNCRLMNDYCESKGTDYTRMWTVLQHDNLHEAELFIDTAYEMGFKRLTLSMELREWTDNLDLNKFISNNRINHTINQSWVDRLLEKAEKIGLDLTFWNISERFDSDNICFWPFERFLLSSDMMLVPCCIIADPSLYSYGHYDSFRELWFGEILRKFRQMHIDGQIIKECRQCYKI